MRLFVSFAVMRLGKKKEKEKENEPKSQTVEGVTRLICSAKTHNIPLRGNNMSQFSHNITRIQNVRKSQYFLG